MTARAAGKGTVKLTAVDERTLIDLCVTNDKPMEYVCGASFYRLARLRDCGLVLFIPPRLTQTGFDKAQELIGRTK